MISMGTLIVLLMRDLATVKLLVAWSVVGAVIYVLERRRPAG